MMIKSALHMGNKTSQEMGTRMEQREEVWGLSPTLNRSLWLIEDTRAVPRRNCFDPERIGRDVHEDWNI